MSIESRKPYRIMNRLAGLAIYLSEEDNRSLIGEYVEPVDRQTWIPVIVPSAGADGVFIKSKETGEYIGFEGDPKVGVKVIAGDRSIAKLWVIQVKPSDPDYKIKLHHDPSYVIEFPMTNLQPGTHARLARDQHQEDGHLNQVWVFTKLT